MSIATLQPHEQGIQSVATSPHPSVGCWTSTVLQIWQGAHSRAVHGHANVTMHGLQMASAKPLLDLHKAERRICGLRRA